MNNYSELQVNIFSNNSDIRLHVENSTSKKGHNFVQKNWRITSSTDMGSLLIVKNYSKFQVYIFSNNRDIRKCQSFLTTVDDPYGIVVALAALPPAAAATPPRLRQYHDVFFQNSRAKNSHLAQQSTDDKYIQALQS